VVGLLAGYYPAMLISRLKPMSIVRGDATFRINPGFSRVLVVVQFTCCIVLMMAAFVIQRQMSFINHKDLGFDKEQVLVVHNQTFDGDLTARLRERLYAFARTQPSIIRYTSMAGDLTGGGDVNSLTLHGQQYWLKMFRVDYDFFGMMGLKVIEGRSFSPQYPMDSDRAARPVVVNETLFKMLGKDAKLNVYNEAIRGTIIGVVPDYHFESLSKKIGPEMHPLVRGYISDFLFKVRAGQTQAAIAALQAEWKRITDDYPFQYTFLDQSIAQMYEADLRWQKAISASSFFAILIACMGLFGLSAINAGNRTKEIGIRKVLGATIKDLVTTLSVEFVGMVLLSILIAAPLGWWLMNRWLEDFAYRIGIEWWMFLVVGAAALVVALGTVSVQVWRAARANPVEALRAE
jgi:putative ABC transport system permease protein